MVRRAGYRWREAMRSGVWVCRQVQNELGVKADMHPQFKPDQRRYCANRARLTTAILLVELAL